jgi:hypothetical protein
VKKQQKNINSAMLRSSIAGLIFVLGAFFAFPSSAQRETVNQSVEWLGVTSNIKISNRVSLLAEGQFRFVQSLDPMQFQFRTGIDISVNKSLSIMPLGYVYTWNELYGKQPASFVNNEHRLFEQMVYKQHVGRVHFQHRLRLEQRFIQIHSTNNGEVINEGYHLKTQRYRYRFSVNIPLNKSKMEAGTLYANIYDEVFLSRGKSVSYHQPDQNRVFAGVGYQFTKLVSMQAGAFYQLLIKSNGTKQENNVGLQVQVNYNIDLMKKD